METNLETAIILTVVIVFGLPALVLCWLRSKRLNERGCDACGMQDNVYHNCEGDKLCSKCARQYEQHYLRRGKATKKINKNQLTTSEDVV